MLLDIVACLRQHVRRGEGIPSQIEEIIANTDAIQIQNATPDRDQRFLDFRRWLLGLWQLLR